MAEKLLKETTSATGLEERKGKALVGRLLGTVEDVASKIHEPTSKALKDAVPQLEEWIQIAAAEDNEASEKEQEHPAAGGVIGQVTDAVTAVAEKVVPGFGSSAAGSMVTSMPQLEELMERLGMSKTDKPDAPKEVASAFSTFLSDKIMPADVFDKVKGMLPWLSGEHSGFKPCQLMKDTMHKAEEAAEAATSAAVGAIGKITGASKEETDKKQKSIVQSLRSSFMSLFRKKGSDKGKEKEPTATDTDTGTEGKDKAKSAKDTAEKAAEAVQETAAKAAQAVE